MTASRDFQKVEKQHILAAVAIVRIVSATAIALSLLLLPIAFVLSLFSPEKISGSGVSGLLTENVWRSL